MPDDIALKMLRPSDLTLFDPIWQRENEAFRQGLKTKISKQKAINLNAREFLDGLYPGVRNAALGGLTSIKLSLTIFGPESETPHNITRKAVRSPGSKNWRLNGETIHEPEGEKGRYANLQEGDLALLKFKGEPQPTDVTVALVSPDTAGSDLIPALMQWMDDTGMVLLSPEQLASSLEAARVPSDHFLWRLANDPETEIALEQSVEGDDAALSAIRRRRGRGGGSVSLEQWLKARAGSEATGRAGEELIAAWLQERSDSLDWVSNAEPLAPYDMFVRCPEIDDCATFIDVKTTKGNFETRFHLSHWEARFAASFPAGTEPYRIIRVFNLGTSAPAFSISDPINDWARQLISDARSAFPEGVSSDGFVIDPKVAGISWGPVIFIEDEQEE